MGTVEAWSYLIFRKDWKMITAIMVDGGFYRKRARHIFGEKSPPERASELYAYCCRHLKDKHEERNLYRIFYYDCPPSGKEVYNPIDKKNIQLNRSPVYKWANDFFQELIKHRKVALRMGEVLESSVGYTLRPGSMKKLLQRKIDIDDLTISDFSLDFKQKGVDMRVGLDIASLAHKRLVNQIVLIAGDSDFIPAAKHARREGIDFILDPMWQDVKPSLLEHIDGLHSPVHRPGTPGKKDPLCVPEDISPFKI